MKLLLTAAITFGAALSVPAFAIEYQTPVSRQLYTCSGTSMSRVALQDPAPCCVGQFKCPQLLSTQGLIRGRRDPST